jgi:hypothetical protein
MVDTDLLEQGTVGADGTPTVIRWSRLQRHIWTDPTGTLSEECRIDGPAVVELKQVKTLIQGDFVRKDLLSPDYFHRWFINGKELDPNKMAQIISKNGLIMREGPLHDHPAFPRPDDLLIWHAAWNH